MTTITPRMLDRSYTTWRDSLAQTGRRRMGARMEAWFVPRSIESGQFRSNAFVIALKNHGLVGSMGRVAACDNAAMESFFCCSRRTCSIGNAGPAAKNSASRS